MRCAPKPQTQQRIVSISLQGRRDGGRASRSRSWGDAGAWRFGVGGGQDADAGTLGVRVGDADEAERHHVAHELGKLASRDVLEQELYDGRAAAGVAPRSRAARHAAAGPKAAAVPAATHALRGDLEPGRPGRATPRDEVHHTAHGRRPVDRALGASRYFDALEIGEGQTLKVEEPTVLVDLHAVEEDQRENFLTPPESYYRWPTGPRGFVDVRAGEPAGLRSTVR